MTYFTNAAIIAKGGNTVDRKEYLKLKRDALLNSLVDAEGTEKREILMRIINLDLETLDKDTYTEKKPGKYTLTGNRFIYIN